MQPRQSLRQRQQPAPQDFQLRLVALEQRQALLDNAEHGIADGDYNDKPIQFAELSTSRFPINLFDSLTYGRSGCGATALAALTGISPIRIMTMVPSGNYTEEFMTRFLRLAGLRVNKLTKAGLTGLQPEALIKNLNETHVVLFRQLMRKQEASWLITWGGIVWHNFEATTASFYNLLNFPLLSALVISNPSWKRATPLPPKLVEEESVLFSLNRHAMLLKPKKS